MQKIIELLLKIIDLLAGFSDKKPEDDRETPEPDFLGNATIGIIVGHTRRARGASFALGGNEYTYNSEVAEIAKDYADSKYSKFLKTHVIFRDGIGIEGAYKRATDFGCDVVVELHFNAFNESVTGTETLTTTHVGDMAFGLEMQKMMCSVFNREGISRDRKAISRSARGGRNVYSFDGYNCLVEPFFGDVPSEAQLANDKKELYARSLIETNIKFCKEYLGIL